MSQVALNFLCESQNTELEYIYEEQNRNGEKAHYLQGPFMMAEAPNKNRRVYKLSEMVSEVDRYNKEYIQTHRSLGELSHPHGESSAEINPANACHLVVEMHQQGNMFYGKTKILSTPSGTIVKQLLSDGVRLGISSRALGKLIPREDNTNLVENFHLICLDLVHEPSAPAMLESVLESKQYLIDEGGRIVEASIRDLEKAVSKLPMKGSERDAYIEEAFANFFKKLTGK